MIRKRARLKLVVALLATTLVAGVAAPAFAGPVFSRPRGTAITRPLSRSAGVPRPSALPSSWSESDIPMGSQLKGSLRADGGKILWVPLYAGQRLHVELRSPQKWAIALWNGYIDPDQPIAFDLQGYPLSFDYVAGQVTGDYYDNGEIDTYDWGWYPLYVYGAETVGGSYTLNWSITDPVVDPSVRRIAGANRYETSARSARWAFTSAETVVVATGRDFADALTASSLCGSYDAPLLLSDPNGLPTTIRDAIVALGARRVFIIGGTKSVPLAIETRIDALPGVETSRVAGVDRYSTAAAIARKVRAHEAFLGRDQVKEAFVANGKNFPDALAVSPYAYSQRIPILLATPAYLPAVTKAAFGELTITRAHVMGSASAVGLAAVAAIPLPADRKLRIEGADRLGTSAAAIDYAVGRSWGDWSQVGIVTGWNFPDALGGGVAMGKRGGVLLLTKPLWMREDTEDFFTDNATSIDNVTVFGGPTTISGFVLGEASEIINY